MDPTETLRRLRALIHDLDDGGEHSTWAAVATDIRSVAEAFGALDGWMSRGGFLPKQWRFPSDVTARGLEPK